MPEKHILLPLSINLLLLLLLLLLLESKSVDNIHQLKYDPFLPKLNWELRWGDSKFFVKEADKHRLNHTITTQQSTNTGLLDQVFFYILQGYFMRLVPLL